jgi:hypothetical protein
MVVNSLMKLAENHERPWSPTDFESIPGTYALLLSSATDAVIRVGRLGDLRHTATAASWCSGEGRYCSGRKKEASVR